MFNRPPSERKRWSWFYVVAWTAFIYTCIPLARAIQSYVDAQWGRQLLLWFVMGTIGITTVTVLIWLCRQAGRRSAPPLLWLTSTGGLFLLWTWHLRSAPEEALHFVQYGVSGVLAYRALLHHFRDPTIYLCAVLIGGLLGTLDEIIQWVTPGRFFDFRDIGLNAGAALLVHVGMAWGIRPAIIAGPYSLRGIRLAARLLIAQLLLLGACASNTIPRVDAYASRIPGLGFLRTNESIMIEYGCRYEDPDIGVFFSRFAPDELARRDREQADETAAILNAYHDPRRYGEFLRTYPPAIAPFAHEARVHLYRRDRYRGYAREQEPGSRAHAHAYTVAFREQLIMERYFSNTLAASRYAMTDAYRAYLADRQIDDARYVSAVSNQLITRWREPQLWAFIIISVIVIGLVPRYYERHVNQRGPLCE